MKLSIIIPAYNEEDNLPRIIHALRSQSYRNFEIIVVDNNSRDKTFKIAKTLADKAYRCREQGISPARNYGAKKSKAEIIAFLDADSIPNKDWVKTLVSLFKRDSSLDVITGMDWYDYKNVFGKFILNGYVSILFNFMKILNFCGISMVWGNNMAIKRNLFLGVGGFDKLIVEDYYFSLKLKKEKVKSRMVNNMGIILSGRRAEKQGLFNLLWFWLKCTLIPIDSKNYKFHDNL